MIQIYINGCELAIYRDTTLNIEYNNAMFATDAIEGDIVYNFEFPIKGNEKILEWDNLPQKRTTKEYECTIKNEGLQLCSGKMIVQKIDSTKFSAAVIINPYPENFAERIMTKNEGEEIIISQSIHEHQEKWKEYLEQCLDENSEIKFAPICNPIAYGDEVEDFGFWGGFNQGKIVNRAIFHSDGSIVENSDSNQIFNKEIDLVEKDQLYVEKNQNCFAPQIKLSKVLNEIAKNAGYVLKNKINNELDKIYIQSLSTLDGNETQYAEINSEELRRQNAVSIYEINSLSYIWNQQQYYRLNYTLNGQPLSDNGTFKIHQAGRYHFEIDVEFSSQVGYNANNEMIMYIHTATTSTDITPNNTIIKYSFGTPATGAEWNKWKKQKFTGRIYIPVSYTNRDIKITIRQGQTGNTRALVILKYVGPMKCTLENSVNCYAKSFKTNEMMPTVSNGEFLRSIISGLGLNYYIDYRKKEIEISTFRDTINAKSINLNNKIIDSETNIEKTENKRIKFKLTQVEECDIEKENYAGEMNTDNYFDPNFEHNDEVYLFDKANGYYKAEEEEDEEKVWITKWKMIGGNAEKIEIGKGKEEEQSTTFKLPANRTEYEDQVSGGAEYGRYEIVPSIPVQLNSKMSKNKEENPNDIILMYLRKRRQNLSINEIQNDTMMVAGVGGFELKAKGKNSLGEKYLKKYLEIKNIKDKITYKMWLTTKEAYEITRLLQPQDESPQNQTRFIIVQGVKSVPEKITLQIENQSNKILCEIKAVKMN